MVQAPKAGVLFLWVCRDSREAAQGVQPLVAAKPPYRSAGKAPCAEISPRQSAQRPSGCISAPLLPRDYSACRFLGSFSQKLPRRFTCEDKPEKGFRFLVAHVDQLRRDTLHIPASRTKAVVALLALLNGKPAVKHLASVLILPDFLLREFQLGVAFLDGLRRFSFRHARSFLPVGIKKGGYFGLEIVALWVRYSVYGVLSAL